MYQLKNIIEYLFKKYNLKVWFLKEIIKSKQLIERQKSDKNLLNGRKKGVKVDVKIR